MFSFIGQKMDEELEQRIEAEIKSWNIETLDLPAHNSDLLHPCDYAQFGGMKILIFFEIFNGVLNFH